MKQYYGVVRSDASNTLQHYGIKGMRWGVRKAIASQNKMALDKQYYKAEKKLEKLNKKADSNYQKVMASKRFKKAGLATADTGLGAGIHTLAANSLYSDAVKKGSVKLSDLIASGAGAAVAAVGAGRAAYNLGRGIKNKINASYSGNRRAVAKRDEWKREMNKAFAGTQYANGGGQKRKKHRG